MKIKILTLSLLVFSIIACKNSSKTEDTATANDSAAAKFEDTLSAGQKQLLHFKFLTAVANLPSPFEMINVVYNQELPFNESLINPVSNIEKYKSGMQQAYNYGTYGVDLSYISFYGGKRNLLNYYNAVKELSVDLSIDKVFDEYAGKFADYQDNKDSLVVLLDRAFGETDSYLRKYKKHLQASEVLAGAIIETHYLSVMLMKDQDRNASNNEVYTRIYNHKLYFYHLINLFKELKADKDAGKIYDALVEYDNFFKETVSEDANLNKESLNKLTSKITELRAKFI